MTTVRAAPGGRANVTTAPGPGRPARARWLRRARAAAMPGLAVTMLLALAGCGGVPGSPGTHAPQAPGTAAATSPPGTPRASPSAVPRPSPAHNPAPVPAASPSRPAATFQSSATPLDAALRGSMTGVSWRPGCPVPLASLRLLRLSYWGFDGRVHEGELVVNADAVAAVRTAFRLLFEARYPVRRMRLVEAYGGSDERSMLADNTSAFNCRGVPGSSAWSQHAYGRAVDLNPFENPEVRGTAVDPPAAAAWTDRSRTAAAVIHHGDAAWQAFAAAGWTWGGDWSYPLDYMHFSANGM
jgi:D-alanyl-D-alanine carboxypeptidase-like protein